jgi:hypothetical protein
LHLQLPEARDQEQKQNDGGVLEDRDPARGELRIVMQSQGFAEKRVGISLARRNNHRIGWNLN